jgi:hypothetical protein
VPLLQSAEPCAFSQSVEQLAPPASIAPASPAAPESASLPAPPLAACPAASGSCRTPTRPHALTIAKNRQSRVYCADEANPAHLTMANDRAISGHKKL